MKSIKDFLEFTRFKLCILCPFLAMSGYLLFNELSANIVFVSLSSFFVCMGAYSINNIVDVKEDFINRKKINPFASKLEGKIISGLAFSLGLYFCSFLSYVSVMFYVIAVFTSITYSVFVLKKYLFMKNLYTGFGVAQVFLIGAFASTSPSQAFLYYAIISLFILIGSMISDIRDYEGDKASGFKTLPVYLGCGLTKKLILSLILIYMFIITLAFPEFMILLPFLALKFLFLYKNRISFAHLSGTLAFIFLSVGLMI